MHKGPYGPKDHEEKDGRVIRNIRESNIKHLQKLREIMRPRKRLRDDMQYTDPDPNAADSDNGDVELGEETKAAIQRKMPAARREKEKHHPQGKLDAPTET